MRTRNSRVYRVFRTLPAALSAAALLAAVGCGGGGGDSSGPSVTRLADSVVTNPSPLTFAGGTAALKAQVDDPSGVDPATVMVDVKTDGGVSLTGGPQVMTSSGAASDLYTSSVTLPNNATGTTPVVYTVTVTAKDLKGNIRTSPASLGTITVPNPPPPPGGP